MNLKKGIKIGVILGILIILVWGFTYKEKLLEGKFYSEIKVKEYGSIYIELDADKAPRTVENFINLVEAKFYDGLTFHRVVKDFMIQGGDPKADGTGGTNKTIVGEFASNGYKNDIKHERGVISMARSQDNNSASSQFFIVEKTSSHLDGNYAAFGYVTKGMSIVDKIVEDTYKNVDTNGLLPKDKQPIIESIRMINKKVEEEKTTTTTKKTKKTTTKKTTTKKSKTSTTKKTTK